MGCVSGAPAFRPPPSSVSRSSLKSGSSPSARSRAAANPTSICHVADVGDVQTQKDVAHSIHAGTQRSRGGSIDLSFTLDSLFACPLGKLALLSNEVDVEPACPKLSIMHRPTTASSVRLEGLASVILLFLLRDEPQGAASSKQDRVDSGKGLQAPSGARLQAPRGAGAARSVGVRVCTSRTSRQQGLGVGPGGGGGGDVGRLRLVGPPPWLRSSFPPYPLLAAVDGRVLLNQRVTSSSSSATAAGRLGRSPPTVCAREELRLGTILGRPSGGRGGLVARPWLTLLRGKPRGTIKPR